MPAFYRMPVFYLLAVVALAAGAVGSLNRRARSAGTESRHAHNDITPPSPKVVAPQSPPPVDPDDGILRTPEGLRRKVLIKDLDVVCRSDPDGGITVGAPLDYFAIRYLYGETPPGQPKRMLQIGLAAGHPEGWVPAESVLEWDTRLMARPTVRAGRPPLRIYRDKTCLLETLAGRRCPAHQGQCPLEGEERTNADTASQNPAAGLPILSSLEIPQPEGVPRTIFEIVSLVRDEAPLPPPKEPPPDLRPALRHVYIAFAIDTTRSMQASIDAVKRMAAELVADASLRYADVVLRLGLIEYRDTDAGYGFTTRLTAPFTSAANFRRAIEGVTVSRHADGSVDEAVLDGIAAALPRPGGEKVGAVDHLDWPSGRAGELASKLLVLLGDAPDHARDLARTQALAEYARKVGITIATVSMEGVRSANDEEPRYRAQWHALAEGSFRPRDRGQGFQSPIDPIELALDNTRELAPRLQALIDDRIEYARNLAALAAAEAEQRLAAYVNSQGLTLDQVYPVLVDLHRGERAPQPRPDPRFQGRKAPSVRKGWIARAMDGKPLVSVEVLMARAELDTLIAELTSLQQAAQGTARDLADLLRIGTAAAAGETAFLTSDRGDQTFADHLRRRQGLPPARPDSLLRRTQADLLQADDSYRQALEDRLAHAIAELVRRRNEPDWDDPKRTIEGMALVPYDFIDF
jgi:hypothetical protein